MKVQEFLIKPIVNLNDAVREAAALEWKGVSEADMILVQNRFTNVLHKSRVKGGWEKANGLSKKFVVEQRVVPLKNAYPLPVREFGWEYWFNYFWNEIPQQNKREEYYLKISPANGQYRFDADVPVGEKTKILTEMMDLGFVPFIVKDRLTREQMFQSMLLNTAPGSQYKGYQLQNQGLRIVFRGDGRLPPAIKANEGTKPQTRVDALFASRSFDQPWHPWSNKDKRELVYFRRGPNQDNCLFSAISVSPEFFVATKFPLFEEVQATQPWNVGKATVRTRKFGPAKGVKAMKERFEAMATDVVLSCSRTNVYAVKVKKGYNTEAKQADAFPERAFENLRWIDHFAFLRVIRIHFGAGANDGHLILVEDSKILQDDTILAKYLQGRVGAFKSFVSDMTQRAKLRADGTGGIPYTPPGVTAPLTIDMVKSIKWG
ncbi:MAG: hypothetical protein ACREUE_03165 [Panacagrimonas sp.]